MSKRTKIHQEYYKKFGTRKGSSKVSEHYVKWLEDKVIELRTGKTTSEHPDASIMYPNSDLNNFFEE